jgi:hypothetical protein
VRCVVVEIPSLVEQINLLGKYSKPNPTENPTNSNIPTERKTERNGKKFQRTTKTNNEQKYKQDLMTDKKTMTGQYDITNRYKMSIYRLYQITLPPPSASAP